MLAPIWSVPAKDEDCSFRVASDPHLICIATDILGFQHLEFIVCFSLPIQLHLRLFEESVH